MESETQLLIDTGAATGATVSTDHITWSVEYVYTVVYHKFRFFSKIAINEDNI